RRHRHRQPLGPPAHRPRLHPRPRTGRGDRHRHGDPGRTDVPARRAHDHRSGRVLALPAEGAPRLGEHRPPGRTGPERLSGLAPAVLAALTFLPAALMAVGRAVFWPFQPKARPASASIGRTSVWGRIASLVAKRPRAIWIGLVIVLALPLLAAPQFKASGVAQSEFVLGDSEARDGQDVLSAHFPGG